MISSAIILSVCIALPDVVINPETKEHVAVQLYCDETFQHCAVTNIVQLGVEGKLVTHFSPLATECVK